MKRTPLRRTSKKLARQLREWRVIKAQWLAENPFCEIDAPDGHCTLSRFVTVHHIARRYGKNLTDRNNFATACANCHHYIHFVSPGWAKKAGWLK